MGDRFVRVAAVLVSVLALAGCDLGAKQDLADRVADARHANAGVRATALTLTVKPKKLPSGAAAQPGAVLTGPYAASTGAIDTGRGISALYAPPPIAAHIAAITGATDPAPTLVFADRASIVVRRPAREVVAARPWYRLELEDVREVTRPRLSTLLTARNPSDLAVLNPSFMVDLLAGVLAGSVERSGGTIEGRFSLDKANREDDLEDDEIEARRQALRLFAVSDDVHDFRLRLDAAGAIRSLRVVMVMKPDKQTRFELIWDMKVSHDTARIIRPAVDDSVRISSFNQVRAAIVGWTAAA